MKHTTWDIAVIGAGPVGLALALHAARLLPLARISVFDARPLERDVGTDARTLALSLGSVQFLQRLGCWPAAAAQPITAVHVSQQPPTLPGAEVRLSAAALGLPQLGAVLGYGALVAPLQAAWLAAVAAEPRRLQARFGTPVAALKPIPGGGVEVDAGIVETHDLAVVAEGGVFGEQARQGVVADYRQTAWVGHVGLQGATPGMAFERFTRHGPAALLPLLPSPPRPSTRMAWPGPGTGGERPGLVEAVAEGGQQRAALVWCVPSRADPVQGLSDEQRLAVLNTVFPPAAGRLVSIAPLQAYPLGLNAGRTLVSGRTVRIGNAAQTLHPVAGQGLNLGLRDAHELVSVLRWADDLDAALRRAEWARAADRWSTIAATDFLARTFTWRWPGAAAARGLGLAALQAFPPGRDWLARRMMFGMR